MPVLRFKYLSFYILLPIVLFLIAAPSMAAGVSVTVNAASAIRTIPDTLFGQNMSVYDGSATAGNTNYVNALSAMGTYNLRFPGGSWSDGVDWSNLENGPAPGCSSGSYIINISEGIAFAKAANVPLQCIVNYGGYWCPGGATSHGHAAAVSLASAWVNYMNKGAGNYKVTYWEVGNEIFGSWENGYETNGTNYGNNFVDFYNAMKAVDSTIKVGAICQDESGWMPWSEAALSAIKAKGVTPDYLISHAYPIGNAADNTTVDNQLLTTEVDAATTRTSEMNTILSTAGFTPGSIPYWMTEYRSTAPEQKTVEWVDAMWSAQYLLELGRNGWQGANIWAIKNGFSSAVTSDFGLLRGGSANSDDTPANNPRPAWYIFPYLSKVFGRNLVSATTSLAAQRCWASKDASGNLTVFTVNNTATSNTVTITVSGFSPGTSGNIWTLAPAGTTKSGASTPAQELRWISVNGTTNPAVSAVPGTGNSITTGASFPVTVPAYNMVLVKVPPGGTPVPTSTPTRTVTPTPTQCTILLNGTNSLTENGTWSGVNATRSIATSGLPSGMPSEGSGALQVHITTGSAYNADIANLAGFSPAVFGSAVQLQMEVNAAATLVSALGGWHSLVLVADSSAGPVTTWQSISSDSPTLVAGQQTLTFNLDYPQAITSASALSTLRIVLNAQNAAVGDLFIDNIRLVNSCGIATPTFTPTRTPTPCSALFNGCQSAVENGTWSGNNATRTFVNSAGAVAGMPSQGTTCMKVQVTTPSGYNNDLFNLSGFTPTDLYGTTRISMDLYADAALVGGGYNQLILFADSGPNGISYQGLSSTVPTVVAGLQTLTWTIDFQNPGGGASSLTSAMPITKLYFVYNTGAPTALGNFYVDNIQFLHDGCIPTHTPVPTATPTRTATSTPTNSPTRTPSSTPTSTSSPTASPSMTLTSSPTATRTSTPTASMTPTASLTATPSASPTRTSTSTAASTATSTPSSTASRTATSTASNSPTASATSSFTPTSTPTRTASMTSTASPSSTPTVTRTFTNTDVITPTPTSTPTVTVTSTASGTPTSTFTNTPTATASPSRTSTSTSTATATFTMTLTGTPTSTPTITPTPTNTDVITPTPTSTGTMTFTPSPTATYSPTPTFTSTSTDSMTPSATASSTPTPSSTSSWTASLTASPSATPTRTFTGTSTVTSTPTVTATFTNTNVITPTPTSTGTSTGTSTASTTATTSPSATASSTPTASSTSSWTLTASPSATPTWTSTSTPMVTFTPSATATRTPTSTSTVTFTPTFTLTPSFTPTVTLTPTPSSTSTKTSTATGVPKKGGVVPYPNPVSGPGPISVQITLIQPESDVKLTVFTTAFRKVNEMDLGALPIGVYQVGLSLRDKAGADLANGLYYIVVHSSEGRFIGKLLISR
ncbi:MAG TPA: FlgD immunoglobulin-like domain containing protein [bacterium]|nr:FlgD immunoglobulin-like domain containing protein [bacterium]